MLPYLDLRPHDPSAFHIRPLRPTIEPEDEAHRHNFQEIMWVRSGTGQHQIDQTTYELKGQSVYVITKGQVHHFYGGKNMVGYLVRFTDEFLLESLSGAHPTIQSDLFSHLIGHQEIEVKVEIAQQIEALLQLMLAEQNRGGEHGHAELQRHLLRALLVLMERAKREGKRFGIDQADPQKVIYSRFMTLLEKRYKETHFVEDYARELGMTSRQLTRILHKLSGRTAKQLIHDRLVLDAKRYLRHSNYSIKEISFDLGFKDPSYFSRVFRRQTNLSPQAYRG